MRMSEGVEWGLHCCVTLGWLDEHAPVSIRRLALWFDLPQEYLKKRLQALARAGILTSSPGIRGGWSLTRPAERITVMEVVAALEDGLDLFRCTEVRQRGAGGANATDAEFAETCGISAVMRRAEMAWRRELAAHTIADLMERSPQGAERTRRDYLRMAGSA
ncbi:RrF2 family transcriptional regulator [Actinomadura harenae]|uniref:Rrf2 family transcriptional regulator n=1 Tax=Actinomadura harenae TaxID=2483351 RepID=A0A3M2LP23_9ACTN|nr:Rrf2 family transcriptional regulator [Actinomadura harenae]RMI39179.1 Rrf2 family transcriptional regulator [Actinomadura harenae]